MNAPITVAVLTVSDRCSRGDAVDTSGPALSELVARELSARVVATACVPDEQDRVAGQLIQWSRHEPHPSLILTTGGTGLAPRDVTPEATLSVLDRRHAGLIELARLRCYPKTPRAFLSRGEAGTIGRTLVINLPGSHRGAVEMLSALIDILPHAIQTLRGEAEDHDRAGATPTCGDAAAHEDV